MTIQEMFDRAVIGLASQNFEQCIRNGLCAYASPDGTRHCAWGWVDPGIHHSVAGSVTRLRDDRIGLAADLTSSEHQFAKSLQRAHDYGNMPQDMRRRLRTLAVRYSLATPAVLEAP